MVKGVIVQWQNSSSLREREECHEADSCLRSILGNLAGPQASGMLI